jgi:pyruvate,water dikinase
VQDGSKAGFGLSSTLAGLVGKMTGPSLQEFLDNLGAYYYFPLVIARNSEMGEGTIRVEVQVVGGHIDQAGGIVFALKNSGNYFVFRINALEDNVILFEYINGKRLQRKAERRKIESRRWYGLKVEINGRQIKGYVDGQLDLEYESPSGLSGYVGLWTKADSVTEFRDLIIEKQKLGDF